MIKIMNRSVVLNSVEVAELRTNKEIVKVVSLSSGYDHHDLLSVYCIGLANSHSLLTELDVIVADKVRFGTLFATSCYLLFLKVL